MIRIIGILLLGLLGLLGCSDSNEGTLAVGEAIPVAPFGIIETPSPTYEWTPVQGATKYRLFVQDTNQSPTLAYTSEVAVIDEWYTAEEAGCASEDGLCMATPDTEVFDENTWKVQACGTQECGLWSESLNFDFTALNAPRFTDHGDGTVTDNKTNLMWSKDADLGGKMDLFEAKSYCDALSLADHKDWYLPYVTDMFSLLDRSHQNPALPPGHPFTNVQSSYYWTHSYNQIGPILLGLDHGGLYFDQPDHDYSVWCVRAGN